MSHQQPRTSGHVVAPEASAVLPDIANTDRNALEQLRNAFAEYRPLAILISEVKSAGRSVIQSFLAGIGGDVTVVRVSGTNSNAIAGMREIVRAVGFDPKHMSVSEMENVLTMFLSYQMANHRRTIICVDEAPDNGQWVFDRVQHLVKLETDGKRGLMVILSGGPGLNESLSEDPLNALAADVAERIRIAPSTRDGTQQYVRRRSETGNDSEVDQLSGRHAFGVLHMFGRGVPDAVKKLYAKYLHMATKEKTADGVKKSAGQLRRARTRQHSDVVAPTVAGNGASRTIGHLIVHLDDEIIQTPVPGKDHILIGRSKMCDLRLASHDVSRHHAMVVNSSNGTELVDLRSMNGTFVDGHQIGRHPLRDYDAISIGDCMIRYISDGGR